MKTIRGHYDGSVVILDEPAPVDGVVPVCITFPEPSANGTKSSGRFGWDATRGRRDGFDGDVADEVVRQRGLG